jgi:hypothetical protein
MAEVEHASERTKDNTGRIEVWLRDDGLFGVSFFPDSGPDHSCTSSEDHEGFPGIYDERALLEWGHAKWLERRMGAD